MRGFVRAASNQPASEVLAKVNAIFVAVWLRLSLFSAITWEVFERVRVLDIATLKRGVGIDDRCFESLS